ncbi:unnamed protein product [Diatraea saccharalis]|uniref:Uncharacterized protein n=1 Tax=Diatraea saccharalis TaxID=40085 RepID=A0A9P0G2F9_9NEOP|nr:unnamed protein product [Diatraea saccharalis]
MTQTLQNEGFHRNISYGILFYIDYESEDWINNNCIIALDQTLPPGVYVNPDELSELRRINALNAVPKNRVSVELTTEQSEESSVCIIGLVSESKVDLWLPVHARYHEAVTGGGMARNKIEPPTIYLRCSDQRFDVCGKPIPLSVTFLCKGDSRDKCSWREIPYDMCETFIRPQSADRRRVRSQGGPEGERSVRRSTRIRLITSRDLLANLTGDARARGREPRGRAGAEGPAPRRYGFEINEDAGRGRAARGGRVFTCGCRRRVQRAAIDAGRGARAAEAGRAPRAAPGLSPPRGRVRAVVACRLSAVRRAGVSPRSRAPGGGGEPRAARPRAHAAAARSSSAPPSPPATPAPARRRARSLAARRPPECQAPASQPRLRPVFLWARQLDGTVQEVRCEDYDPRNRIRIARTVNGWRVIPRTEIYNSIKLPPPPPRVRRDRRRRRRRSGRPRRRRERVEPEERPEPAPTAWLAPDLESHIPSHTIAVPRAAQVQRATPESSPSHPQLASPSPPPHAHSEPTPLDNLLAVAELEFNQQRGEELELELQATASASYAFLPDEAVARDVMSFELDEPKQDGMFFERKTLESERATEEDSFQNDMVVHKDLFETISEAHYLPELGGPHDEELLESLVEKGCEDNQILGQALDKFAHLVHSSGDYVEEEEDILLSGAPVADIIDRLEQSLESPGRSSITAAQGLLHLHHIGDHLTTQEHQQTEQQNYIPDEVFATQPPTECTIEPLNSQPDMHSNEANHLEYDQNAQKRLETEIAPSPNVMYTEPVPEKQETYVNDTYDEQQSHSLLPDQSEITLPSETVTEEFRNDNCGQIVDKSQLNHSDENDNSSLVPTEMDYTKELEEASNSDEMIPTDLSIKNVDNATTPLVVASVAETTNHTEDSLSDKSDDQPKDLSVHRRLPTPHASPKRIDIPRAPSRESDAMQSPQPSGIPAVPSSPEIFTMPLTKSKQTLFLETLLSSPSPKMYTSEVTISKQQCEPLNLGKHRKSASPTVSSCSDEIRKINKEYGEPQEKRIKKETAEELAKISKVFEKCNEDQHDIKPKKPEKLCTKLADEISPLKQLHSLKTSPDFNIPDPLLVPKDKLNQILAAPAREIPALLLQRPELRLPEAFAFPAILQDPDILVISLSQLENILENESKKEMAAKPKDSKITTAKTATTTEQTNNAQQPDQTSQPKPIPSMDALAGDIDAATSAALNQMLWLPYLSQLEAMAACSQNMDFLKALNSSGYTGSNYPDLSQMFGPSAARFMGPTGFPMMPSMDYDNRLQFAMWQEAMNHANATTSQRPKPSTLESQMKDLASKTSDVQNPYVHSTKNSQNKTHTSARTSPIAHSYNSNQRSISHNPFLQGMYPGMNTNIRPNMPLPGLQIPYFNPNLMGSQRSRTGQQKSPTSPYYPNNNYLQSVKQPEGSHQRSSSTSSQESPRPRISVKSLQNLLEPTAAAASGVASSVRRSSNPPAATMNRRRDEPEVGSTTPLGEPPPHMPPHPHDPSSFHLWHPLFGNQKSYNSPWSWTTVTATGD